MIPKGDLRLECGQVLKRQLERSVEEGLASAAGGPDSFESVQRRLLAAVQLASARQSATLSGAAVQEALRKLFPNSYMCGKCGFGPGICLACSASKRSCGVWYACVTVKV